LFDHVKRIEPGVERLLRDASRLGYLAIDDGIRHALIIVVVTHVALASPVALR